MEVVEIYGRFVDTEINGVKKKGIINFVSGVEIGDYVLVHAGSTIARVDPVEAGKTLDFVRQIIEESDKKRRA